MLWAIWCQRVEIAFREDNFHLGAILWKAWRNTIYCAIEAYKELFRHARNEEKRRELIFCFHKVWTQTEIFGRMRRADLKWNLTPHAEFLPTDLGAWNATPIRIHRLSPSPDPEAEFAARPDFFHLVDELLQAAARQVVAEEEPQDIDNQVPLLTWPSTSDNQPSTTRDTASERITTPAPLQPENANHNGNEQQSRKRKVDQVKGKKNTEPTTETNTKAADEPQSSTHTKHMSRPKRKCFKRRHYQTIGDREESHRDTGTHHSIQDSQRTSGTSPHRRSDRRLERVSKSGSRAKERCTFGPRRSKEGRSDLTSDASNNSAVPLQPLADTSTLQARTPPVQLPIGSRPTLTLPFHRYQTPLERYKNKTPFDPPQDPYRPIRRKLGLFEAEFEDRITQDIEELFQEIENERRQALLETVPFGRVLTKADRRLMFNPAEVLASGSLRGVHRWVFDLDASTPLSAEDDSRTDEVPLGLSALAQTPRDNDRPSSQGLPPSSLATRDRESPPPPLPGL